jgi:Mg-chelatase subunit ChlD
VASGQRKTTSRRELARQPKFEQVSPEVGELDEAALDEAMRDDPDQTMALLADLTAATDPRLRELARRLAGRLFLDVSRRGPSRPRGIGKMAEQPYRPDAGDLDLDASLDAIVEAGRDRSAVDPERLRVRGWAKPGTALCLLVDRSGSMGGKPLATSAVAAAAVAWRAPRDYSVIAFGKDVVVAKSQDAEKSSERVVNDVLALRGFGTTDLTAALHTASDQLSRSRAGRKVCILLSDCRSTVEGDHLAAGAALDELVVIAPEGDSDEANVFARQVGARLTTAAGPSSVAEALAELLSN